MSLRLVFTLIALIHAAFAQVYTYNCSRVTEDTYANLTAECNLIVPSSSPTLSSPTTSSTSTPTTISEACPDVLAGLQSLHTAYVISLNTCLNSKCPGLCVSLCQGDNDGSTTPGSTLQFLNNDVVAAYNAAPYSCGIANITCAQVCSGSTAFVSVTVAFVVTLVSAMGSL